MKHIQPKTLFKAWLLVMVLSFAVSVGIGIYFNPLGIA